MTATSRRVWTADELFCLPDDGFRYELVNGELRQMPLHGAEHGYYTSLISASLGVFVYARQIGECFAAGTGFLLAQDPDTVRAPDCAFVARQRLSAVMPQGYLPLAPDLVVETRSPEESESAFAETIAAWLQAGTRLVWAVDPSSRTLTVYRAGKEPRVLRRPDDTIEGEEVLRGFGLPLSRLFR